MTTLQQNTNLRIGLPSKGRLSEISSELLNQAGLNFRRQTRGLFARVSGLPSQPASTASTVSAARTTAAASASAATAARALRAAFNCAAVHGSRCSPGPTLELFGRRPRDGWVVWGEGL